MWIFSHEETEQLGTTTDYRYIGANPNNYVKFNDELWRIIGVFGVDDGTGKIEKRMKIIRNESIGNYSYDCATDFQSGTSEWKNSQLYNLLNVGAYYSRNLNKKYYNYGNILYPDFSTTGLTTASKKLIDNVKWYLGGSPNYSSVSNGLSSHWYKYERGTTVYNGRENNWIGAVWLIYPSDYGMRLVEVAV